MKQTPYLEVYEIKFISHNLLPDEKNTSFHEALKQRYHLNNTTSIIDGYQERINGITYRVEVVGSSINNQMQKNIFTMVDDKLK